jgi:hypothetical protein
MIIMACRGILWLSIFEKMPPDNASHTRDIFRFAKSKKG